MMRAAVLMFLAGLGGVAAGMPDCSTVACPSMCSCFEQKCDASVYEECAADSQCNELMGCLLKCSCGDAACSLGCIAGKTLDPVSEKVKACGISCASGRWEAYKKQFGKTYASVEDEAERKQLFLQEDDRINKLNAINVAQNGQTVFGWTRNTDRRPEEQHQKGYKRSGKPRSSTKVLDASESRNPASIDWSRTHVVSAVKNQGQCGSCWAFSAAETIESQFTLGSGIPVMLSPQQITSCTTADFGCGGGEPYDGYDYLKTVPGLSTEFFWPYNESLTTSQATQPCTAHDISQIDGPDQELIGHYAAISGYQWAVPECSTGACNSQDLAGLAKAVEKTPISICVNAGTFNSYTGGVLTDAACGSHAADSLDHCVQLVGFNTTATTPYWIVRNSWDTEWGLNGYIYFQYDANTCGIADEATIPTVSNAGASTEHFERFYQEAAEGSASTMVV